MNETSYTLNFLFSSNKINIPLANEPDKEEGVSYYVNYQSNNEEYNESPNLFVFLIDQSCSMSGYRMAILQKSLGIFFQSLPVNSYFQLIGFGNKVKY